jgi:hypothetical protein
MLGKRTEKINTWYYIWIDRDFLSINIHEKKNRVKGITESIRISHPF